jgi:hypothetical protein
LIRFGLLLVVACGLYVTPAAGFFAAAVTHALSDPPAYFQSSSRCDIRFSCISCCDCIASESSSCGQNTHASSFIVNITVIFIAQLESTGPLRWPFRSVCEGAHKVKLFIFAVSNAKCSNRPFDAHFILSCSVRRPQASKHQLVKASVLRE